MEQGWIYVLVNSSIPGLVKVGRTTRLPEERAAELSQATGVATPFVVAFEEEFADCIAAEREVHAMLERRGLRYVSNREFFRASPGEIVHVVLKVAARHETDPPGKSAADAEALLADGDRHLFGTGDTMRDLSDAVRLYRRAATAGSLVALERLGAIYAQVRQKSRADRRRAMNTLKEGARRGNYYCYGEMAWLFARDGDQENFAKAWRLFFQRRAEAYLPEVEAEPDRYPVALRNYIAVCLDLGVAPNHMAELRAAAEPVMHSLLAALDQVRDAPEARQRLARVLRWSYQNLTPQPKTSPLRLRESWLAGWFPRRAAA